MRTDPLLRLLGPDDAEAYWHLRLEMLEREPRAFATSADEHRGTGPREVLGRLDGRNAWTMGAFVEDEGRGMRLRGAASLLRETRIRTRHRATVAGVYVGPELRGRGLGHALLTALLAHARGVPGLERLDVAVVEEQTAALALYERLGFTRWGRQPAAVRIDGDDLDEHHLTLAL